MQEYKGYTATMEIDPDAGIIFGRVVGLRDVITFQGETVPDAVRAFHESVDDYLAWSAEKGESPERPFSGKFVLRIGPDLHRRLALAAEARGQSLNGLIAETLAERFAQGGEPGPGRAPAAPDAATGRGGQAARKRHASERKRVRANPSTAKVGEDDVPSRSGAKPGKDRPKRSPGTKAIDP